MKAFLLISLFNFSLMSYLMLKPKPTYEGTSLRMYIADNTRFDGTIGSRKYKDTIIHSMELRITWDTLATGAQEVIWYSPGAGQLGNGTLADSQYVIQYGPEYWIRNGWDGTVTLGNGVHRPVFCTLIQSSVINSSAFTRPSDIKQVLDGFIASRFHSLGKDSAWTSMGFSAGGWVWSEFNTYMPSTGNTTYWNYFKSEVDIEGVVPSDQYDASLAYPQKFGNRAKTKYFRFLGFEQINDTRLIWQAQQNMDDSVSNSAWFAWSNFGGGGHSNFNDFLNPSTTDWTATNTNLLATANGQPSVFIAKPQNVFTWALRQGDTTLSGGTAPPHVTASTIDTVQLPASTTTITAGLTGTGVSVAWTCVVVPNGATTPTITSPTALTTGITGINYWGNYVFKIVASNAGGKDSGYVRINAFPACNTATPVRYNLVASGGQIFYHNATNNQPWRGKDTLVLPEGHLTLTAFGDLTGDLCHPIYIMGPDQGMDSSDVLRLDNHSQYITFIRNPRNPLKQQIWAGQIGGGMTNNDTLAYITVDGSSAPTGSAGITWKVHIDTTAQGAILPETIYPNYLMDNIVFHDMIVDSTDNEGWYLGNSAPNGGDQQGPPGFYPVRMRRLSIYNTRTFHTGWDGIQTSGATDSCLIYNDTVYDYGYHNIGGQQCGIIIGGTTSTNAYNNQVIHGTGNGMEVFGYGTMFIHDNLWDSCGRDGTGNGQQTIYQDTRTSIVTTYPKQKVYYYNNTIRHPMGAGAIVSANSDGTALADSIYGNIFCIPGANSGTYQGLYIITSPTATFASSNTLITSCGTTPPTVNPGPNQQIVYPAQTSITMAGSASGNGGATISSTLWVQISGPNNATITTPSSTTTTVTALVPGTYTFQLQATDNNSNTTVAQMQTFAVQSIYILRKRSHKRRWH